MEQNTLVRTAKTVEEAIELAMLEFGVGRDEIVVDVISRGRAGILGIGSEPAKVRVSLITSDEANASAGLAVVGHFLRAMSVEATPTIRSSGTGPDDPAVIDIQGEDAGLVIGRRGETLRALQFLVNLVLTRQEDNPAYVVVDVEQYRERRHRQIRTLAERMAQRAISEGRPVTLDPMSPADRRLVHVSLADNNAVTTESSGEGSQRRVTISPTGEAGDPPSTPARGGPRGRPPPQDEGE